jgi:serine/threonine protein kinase
MAVDMFACGVILFELLAQVHPFIEQHEEDEGSADYEEHLRYLSRQYRVNRSLQFRQKAQVAMLPAQSQGLIEELLQTDPAMRITALQALSHPFWSDAPQKQPQEPKTSESADGDSSSSTEDSTGDSSCEGDSSSEGDTSCDEDSDKAEESADDMLRAVHALAL